MRKKPKRSWKRIALTASFYTLVSVFFLFSVVTILILANGYKPSLKDGRLRLEKTGMILLSTQPSGAKLFLNGKFEQTTGFHFFPTRLSGLLSGNYEISVTKEGYTGWKKIVKVNQGMVTWANYVLLFPNKLNIEKTNKVTGGYTGKSENGQYLVYFLNNAGSIHLSSYNTADWTEKSFWPTQAVLADQPDWVKTPTIVSAQLDNQNLRLLLTLRNGTSDEQVILDHSGAEVKLLKLSQLLPAGPTQLHFNPANGNDLFLVLNGSLRKFAVSTHQLSDSMADNVISYDLFDGSQIIYATKINEGFNKVLRMDNGGNNKKTILDATVSSQGYLFAYSSVSDVLAVLNKDQGELQIISQASEKNNTIKKVGSGYVGFSWHKNGKKLLYYKDQEVGRYDFEKKEGNAFELQNKLAFISWYEDDCHYSIVESGTLSIVDFDGSNKVTIAGNVAGFTVSDVTRDNNIVYGVSDGLQTAINKFISPF